MSDFVIEDEREYVIDLENLPDSLVYKLIEADFTFGPERFGVNEHLHIEYYERLFERAFPGLLQQFPSLYYMVEEWHREATKRTPLEEILAKKEQ